MLQCLKGKSDPSPDSVESGEKELHRAPGCTLRSADIEQLVQLGREGPQWVSALTLSWIYEIREESWRRWKQTATGAGGRVSARGSTRLKQRVRKGREGSGRMRSYELPWFFYSSIPVGSRHDNSQSAALVLAAAIP